MGTRTAIDLKEMMLLEARSSLGAVAVPSFGGWAPRKGTSGSPPSINNHGVRPFGRITTPTPGIFSGLTKHQTTMIHDDFCPRINAPSSK